MKYESEQLESLYQMYKSLNEALDEVLHLVKTLSGSRTCNIISDFTDRIYDEKKENENGSSCETSGEGCWTW